MDKVITIITRSPAVAGIADRTGCQWHWRSSKVDDFHLIWKNVCHFLLMINSNLGHLSPFPRSFLVKMAAKPLQMKTWLLMTTYRKSPEPYPMVLSFTHYDIGLPFSHNTAQLAYHSALWPFKVIQGQWFYVIWKPICDFLLVINSNLDPYLAPFSHNTFVTGRRTDGRQLVPIVRPLLKYMQSAKNSNSFDVVTEVKRRN